MPKPFIPIPNVLQANCRYLLDGQKIENVFHFDFGEADFPVAASQVSAMLQNEWWPSIRYQLTVNLQFKEIYLVDQTEKDGAVYTSPITLLPNGMDTTDSLPNSVAFCVTLRTAKRGKSYTGRSYVAGLGESASTRSYLLPAVANALVAAYENLRSVAASSGLPMVVASRYHNKEARPVGVGTPVIACVYTDLVLDSQRRRSPGRGS